MVDLLHSSAAASWTNSAAPAAASLSNTVPGYTKLDGQYRFATVAGAATDYVLFGYQVPANYTLKVKGIVIDASNTGAAVATTATLLYWAVATNKVAATLGTSDGQRIGVGMQSFAVAAAVGAIASQIRLTFDVPITCQSGKYFDIILRLPVGTATASQEIAGNITLIAEYI
jgi:hypothetical protein